MKKLLSIFVVCLALASCHHGNSTKPILWLDTIQENKSKGSRVQSLIERLDSAKMLTYTDKEYNVTVKYPDFFDASDTTEAGTARFYYPGTKNRELSLVMFVEPNIEGWNIKEAVEHLSDSVTLCIGQGLDYFIMSGAVDADSTALYYEKCFLDGDQWIDYTLYYTTEYSLAIGNIMGLVIEWDPRKD